MDDILILGRSWSNDKNKRSQIQTISAFPPMRKPLRKTLISKLSESPLKNYINRITNEKAVMIRPINITHYKLGIKESLDKVRKRYDRINYGTIHEIIQRNKTEIENSSQRSMSNQPKKKTQKKNHPLDLKIQSNNSPLKKQEKIKISSEQIEFQIKEKLNASELNSLELFFRYRKGTALTLAGIPDFGVHLLSRNDSKDIYRNKQFSIQEILQKLIKFISLSSRFRTYNKFYPSKSSIFSFFEYDMTIKKNRSKTRKKSKIIDSDSSQDESESPKEFFKKIYDLETWKKRNGIDKGKKVFIMNQNYAGLKEVFEGKGWVENPDPFSCCFDLIFTVKSSHIDYHSLEKFQQANHFQTFDKNSSITSKKGLLLCLSNLIWEGVDIDTFYPRCYYLSHISDINDFIEDFKFTQVYIIVKLA